MGIKLPNDFKEFLKLLTKHNVKYLLIGGYAVSYYGYPRATQDLDIWIAIHPQNAKCVVMALHEFGFDLPDLTLDLFLAQKSIVRMGLPPMRIELMTTISGVDFDACYNRRNKTEIDGVMINIIDLPDLRLNKQASGRHKDLDDLEHLPEP